MEFKKRDVKIYILSGYAKSGKDEVSKIITNYFSLKKVITISYGHYIKDYARRIIGDFNEFNKPRTFLQNFGIELVKEKIDDKLFIRRILEDIEIFSYFYDIIIVNDARLVDEIRSIKDKYKDSINIRIINPLDNNLSEEQKKHKTETDLDNYNAYDYVVTNLTHDKLVKDIESILEV